MLSAWPGIAAWARAVLARALLARGATDAALDHARDPYATLERLGALAQRESLVPLVFVGCLLANDRRTEASEVMKKAKTRLLARAETYDRASRREGFLAMPDSVATLALAAALDPEKAS